MAFLDNSGDIILDAVLTDAGRKRMAEGRFRIVKFAFSDEEINGDFLVDYNQSLRYFNPEISKRMHLYDDQMLSDNLNVMYVSMSRAILENHIICENNESNDVNSSGSLLKSYVLE